jgi:uncharacterized protein YdhG (YjbR/CyaY superfamily)
MNGWAAGRTPPPIVASASPLMPQERRDQLVSAIDDYLEQLNAPEKDALEHICQIARAAVPDAEEATSYGMPAFKHKGKPLLGFTVSQRHLSLHPFSPAAIDFVKDQLGSFELSKGTIRFTPDNPIPDGVLQQIIDARLKEIAAAK